MTTVGALVAIATLIAGLAGGAGVVKWVTVHAERRRLEVETSRVEAETQVALAEADDEHLKVVVDYIVKPLREELGRLNAKVEKMDTRLKMLTKQYRVALEWVRTVLIWKKWHPDLDPPMPPVPPEILDEL